MVAIYTFLVATTWIFLEFFISCGVCFVFKWIRSMPNFLRVKCAPFNLHTHRNEDETDDREVRGENGILSERQQWQRAKPEEIKHTKPTENSFVKIQVQRMLDFISLESKSTTHLMWLITDIFPSEKRNRRACVCKFLSYNGAMRIPVVAAHSHRVRSFTHINYMRHWHFENFEWLRETLFFTSLLLGSFRTLDACVCFLKESKSNKNSYLL